VLLGLVHVTCELYIDDLLVHAQTEIQFLINLEAVFSRLSTYRIIVNPDKCKFGHNSVEYVGHTVDENGLSFSREKIEKVLDIPEPILAKDLKMFVGVAVHFIDHIKNFSTLVHPLHQMLRNYDRNRKLLWTDEGRVAFHRVKDEVNNCAKLFFIDDHSPVFVGTDASDYGLGGYVYQIVDGNIHHIAFVSHSFTDTEARWSTIEKECYAIVYTLKKLEYLLRDRPFVLRTDHKNLTYIDTESNHKERR